MSGFTCDCHGFFADPKTVETPIKIMKPGKSLDGYWTNKDLVTQLESIIPLATRLHPNCQLLFGFDNSQNHHARRPDALCAQNLNLSDGGKNSY